MKDVNGTELKIGNKVAYCVIGVSKLDIGDVIGFSAKGVHVFSGEFSPKGKKKPIFRLSNQVILSS